MTDPQLQLLITAVMEWADVRRRSVNAHAIAAALALLRAYGAANRPERSSVELAVAQSVAEAMQRVYAVVFDEVDAPADPAWRSAAQAALNDLLDRVRRWPGSEPEDRRATEPPAA